MAIDDTAQFQSFQLFLDGIQAGTVKPGNLPGVSFLWPVFPSIFAILAKLKTSPGRLGFNKIEPGLVNQSQNYH